MKKTKAIKRRRLGEVFNSGYEIKELIVEAQEIWQYLGVDGEFTKDDARSAVSDRMKNPCWNLLSRIEKDHILSQAIPWLEMGV